MNTFRTKELKKLTLIAMIISLLFSCSKPLSREEATKQLKQKLQLPKNIYNEFESNQLKASVGFIKWDSGSPDSYEKNDQYPKSNFFTILENEGLITIQVQRVDIDKHLWYAAAERFDYEEYYLANFTAMARPFVNGNSVKVATLEFGEITGIIERKELNIAEVNYTTKKTNITPFGYAYNVNEEVFNNTEVFNKYDDGWRISK